MSAPADLPYLAMFSSKRHQEQFDVCPAGVLVPGSGTFLLVQEAPVRWWRFTRPWKSHPSQRWIKGVQSPGWWREMTVQVFFRKFFTALRKILALYLQDSRGSPGRSPLSQGIYYSCIKRKRFPYSNQKLTEPAPLRTLSEISEDDHGLTALFLANNFIRYSILNVGS